MLKTLNKMGATIYGAELIDSGRVDSENTNTEIMEKLTKANRDMFSLGKDRGQIMQHMADVMIEGLKGGGKANVIAGRALKKGMQRHITKSVVPNIKSNTQADGSPARAVKTGYAKYRAAKYSIPDDAQQVGVASGQLLAAISKGTIRLKSAK